MTSVKHKIFNGPALSGIDSALQPPLLLSSPVLLPSLDQGHILPALPTAQTSGLAPIGQKPIGQLLMDMGALSAEDLVRATALRQRQDTRIGDILLAHGMVEEVTLYAALAVQYGAETADFNKHPADVRLIDTIGADECLRRGILPWRRVGSNVLIACCRPEQFEGLRPRLTELYGPVRMAVVSETRLHEALLSSRQRKLAKAAETRVAAHESCRELDIARLTRVMSVIGFLTIAATIVAPKQMFLGLVCWAIALLVITSGFKLAAAFAQAKKSRRVQSTFFTRRGAQKLPIVSIMVPLFHEREIAGRLIKRLSRLTYPRELLDICLVVEEDDTITQEVVAQTELPRWIRQIVVPRGGVKTKPRALNFALDFCRGSIIGIYDAEDAPEPDQIHKVAHHFSQAGPEVACLQGILDFYNSRTNWLARCFTVEYASWFRVILPGYEKLGLVVPLGGTTLFFRRDAIEKLGGWDAHNVTEDADLGIRLARHGYRTELIRTVTDEEANCRMWPWIKQRSRWLKGYAMTWAMHMRAPRKLLQDLGWWKFIGVQVLFFGALSNAVLAPLLWSFWILPLGFHHPLQDIVPNATFIALGALFLLSEVVTIAIGMVATSTPKHRGLWRWVPTLHFYYPLGTLAAIKGLWEVVTRPYYWDKTAHGVHDMVFEDDETSEFSTDQDAATCAPIQSAAPQKSVLVLGPNMAVATSMPSAPYILGASARVDGPTINAYVGTNSLLPPDIPQQSYGRGQHGSGFAENAPRFNGASSRATQTSSTAPRKFRSQDVISHRDIVIPDIATPSGRRLTFGLNLPAQAKELLSGWQQGDQHLAGSQNETPIDIARLRTKERSILTERNGYTAFNEKRDALDQMMPWTTIANFQVPPELSATAAFADLPDWLPLALSQPNHRIKTSFNQPAQDTLKRASSDQ